MSVKPKKHLGQHFLIDKNICQKIAKQLTGHRDCKRTLEVGPGMGAITKYLIKKEHPFSVIEVDGESITYLRENYPELDVVDFNFLKLDLGTLNDNNPFSLIGNFPYFISAQMCLRVLILNNMMLHHPFLIRGFYGIYIKYI